MRGKDHSTAPNAQNTTMIRSMISEGMFVEVARDAKRRRVLQSRLRPNACLNRSVWRGGCWRSTGFPPLVMSVITQMLTSFSDWLVTPTFYPELPCFDLFYTSDPRLSPLDPNIGPHHALLGGIPPSATFKVSFLPYFLPIVLSKLNETHRGVLFERPPSDWQDLHPDVLEGQARRYDELVRSELTRYKKGLLVILDSLFRQQSVKQGAIEERFVEWFQKVPPVDDKTSWRFRHEGAFTYRLLEQVDAYCGTLA